MRGRRAGWVVSTIVLVLLSFAMHSRPDHATFSLVEVETARTVDFDSGAVWLLLLGSDSREGQDVLRGRADAIQLVGVDFEAGTAVAFGVPRDSWVDIPGHGTERINAGLTHGGPDLMAKLVDDLFGIEPDYVVTIGTEGLTDLVDAVGGLEVDVPEDITVPGDIDVPEATLEIPQGRSRLDGAAAVGYARARYPLARGDFDRSANHQELMRGVVRQLSAHQDDVGFVEASVLRALGLLDTDLDAAELYRLTQAVSDVDLSAVSACVLSGTPGTGPEGESIIYVDSAQARRLADDARDDAHLEGTCRG